MMSFNNWIETKSSTFSEKIFISDGSKEITYAENYLTIKNISQKINNFSCENNHIVFFGDASIEAYQLYFSVISANAIWVPISYRLDSKIIEKLLSNLKPALIIYDGRSVKQDYLSDYTTIEITDLFEQQNNDKTLSNIKDFSEDKIISIYLTSGSTGLPKMVQHEWYATLHHAISTIDRYQFDSESCLFNPRQLFHVSGAFALTTLMHCGGRLVVPSIESFSMSMENKMADWARLVRRLNVTHASFLPSEMHLYADFVNENSLLHPPALKRITTGGEHVELSDLIKVSRVFANNKFVYDRLWLTLYPYLGENQLFMFLKAAYECVYGRLVQVTQTYGATELICNAVANSSISGPDMRGIGTALSSLFPEIINDEGIRLQNDGRGIGRLRFFGNSVAAGYRDVKNKMLTPHCYETNDLATIDGNGRVTLFGRKENLIKLPDVEEMINPVLLQREIKKIPDVKAVMVFEYGKKLHAAIRMEAYACEEKIMASIKCNKECNLIMSVSFWDKFPLTLSGKVDSNQLIEKVKNNETQVRDMRNVINVSNQSRACVIF